MRHTRITLNLIIAVGFLFLSAGMVYLTISDARQDEFDKQRDVAIREAKAETVACVNNVLETYFTGTQDLREAAQTRDDALVASLKAMVIVVDGRVVEQQGNSEAIQQGADQFIVQVRRFVAASSVLNQSRKENPVPDLNKACD
jgi:hypothetical protein